MCGHTRLDRIRNKAIRNNVKLAPVDDEMRVAILRWFGHVRKRSVDAHARICERIDLQVYRRAR